MGYLNETGLSRFFAGIKSRFVLKSSIVNTLTSTATDQPLSAAQGKVLKDRVQYLPATLPVAGWSAAAPYTQTVAVTGMLESDIPVVDVVLSEDVDTAKSELEAYGCVSKIKTGANSIIATCFDDKPTAALNLMFKVVR